MADQSKPGEQGRGAGGASGAGRIFSVPIGEAGADDFALDVVVAGNEVIHAHDSDAAVAGAPGGGTGIGDMAGGTGIGTDDGGNDSGDAGGGDGGTTGVGGR